MIINLEVKPLSVNKCWQGRRFKSQDYKRYETELKYLLPRKKILGKEYEIHYTFYLKNFGLTDIDNLIKPLQDVLVSNGIISDDRKIVYLSAKKVRAKKDKISIQIAAYE